jgi:hypothetical protein
LPVAVEVVALVFAGAGVEGCDAGVAGELGVSREAVDRTDLAEQLRSGERGATGELQQLCCDCLRLGLQLAVEVADRAAEAATASEELACDPRLERLRAAGELAAESFEPDRSIESTERHQEAGVEFVQVPAQPLLAATPFVDQVVAVIDQQLQLTQPSLLGSWRVEQRLAQCRPSDRERVDQIRQAPPANPL